MTATARRRSRVLGGRQLLLLCGAALLGGCGSEAYEQRLEQTRRYFNYLDEVDRTLTPSVWRRDGIELRVPRELRAISLEPTDADEEHDAANKGSRTRHPELLNIPLPGLEGAWIGEIGSRGLSCHLYLLSNRRLLIHRSETDDINTPARFCETAVDEISAELGESANLVAVDDRTYPPANSYSHYRTKAFEHEVVDPGNEYSDRQFDFYMTSFGDVRIVLLFVSPRSLDPNEGLEQRIALCLETLNFVEDR